MSFWKKLIPDEPMIADSEVLSARDLKTIPPAVRAWCLLSIAANAVVIAVASVLFRNAAPLLAGTIFALFPLYMLLFWSDLSSTVENVKQRAIDRSPFVVVNLSVQWCAISLCVCAPVMTGVLCTLLWFVDMKP
jgi:hypothetical protein